MSTPNTNRQDILSELTTVQLGTPPPRSSSDSRAQSLLMLFPVLSPHFNVQNAHPVREVVKVKLFLPLRVCTLTQCLENMQLQGLLSQQVGHGYSSYTFMSCLWGRKSP